MGPGRDDATARRLRTIERATLVERAPARRAAAALAAIAVLGGAMLVASPRTLRTGWRQLLVAPAKPWDGATVSPVPLVGDITVTLTPPGYSRRPPTTMTSTSGDFRALAGTRARIVARALTPAASAAMSA